MHAADDGKYKTSVKILYMKSDMRKADKTTVVRGDFWHTAHYLDIGKGTNYVRHCLHVEQNYL